MNIRNAISSFDLIDHQTQVDVNWLLTVGYVDATHLILANSFEMSLINFSHDHLTEFYFVFQFLSPVLNFFTRWLSLILSKKKKKSQWIVSDK